MSGTLKNPIDKRRLSVKSYPRTWSLSDGLRSSSKFSLLFFHRSSDSLFFLVYGLSFFLSFIPPFLSVSRVTSNIFPAASIYFMCAS